MTPIRILIIIDEDAGDTPRTTYCSFAHGDAELQTPWMPRCIRVIKKDGQLVSLGCRQYGHTFKHCPLRNGNEPAVQGECEACQQ